MARRRVAYQKNQQNRLSMFLVIFVLVVIMAVVAVRSADLREKIDQKTVEMEALEQSIAAEHERTVEIENFEKEIKTPGYIERIAREVMGLIYPGEIQFKKKD